MDSSLPISSSGSSASRASASSQRLHCAYELIKFVISAPSQIRSPRRRACSMPRSTTTSASAILPARAEQIAEVHAGPQHSSVEGGLLGEHERLAHEAEALVRPPLEDQRLVVQRVDHDLGQPEPLAELERALDMLHRLLVGALEEQHSPELGRDGRDGEPHPLRPCAPRAQAGAAPPTPRSCSTRRRPPPASSGLGARPERAPAASRIVIASLSRLSASIEPAAHRRPGRPLGRATCRARRPRPRARLRVRRRAALRVRQPARRRARRRG